MRIEEAVRAYMAHANVYYAGSRERLNCRKTLEWVLRLATVPAGEFTERRRPIADPNELNAEALECVQEGLIEEGLSRGYINQTISRARRIWKWFERKGHVEKGTVEHLKTVPGLQRGRSAARETEPVGPVPLETVLRTIAGLEAPHADIVRLMLYTGARISEILVLRTGDIDRSEDDHGSDDDSGVIWWFEPHNHKTKWRAQERIIPIDDRAQAILLPLLRPFAPDDYLFPASNGIRHLTPSATYHAIRRACERLGIPIWHPHQCRHSVATAADRAGASLEEIQDLLGHADPASTRRYIQKRNERGRAALSKIRRKVSDDERRSDRHTESPSRPGIARSGSEARRRTDECAGRRDTGCPGERRSA